MGVFGLYSFLEKIDALRKVKISEEAQDYRRRFNKSPIIVVDGINMIYEVYKYYHLSYLCGGQLKEYKKYLEYFIEMFKTEGVTLVCFFDGANVMFNVDGWIRRRKENIKFVNALFDKLECGENLVNIEKKKKDLVLPRNIFEVTNFVLKQKGCKIKISVGECDRELALFAKQNNCMAILAIDTDFIIYDTIQIYTTIRMNITEKTFFVYKKRKVLESLMLRSCELPLLASLIGNDLISSSNLYYGFHAQFRKQGERFGGENIFYSIAQYIRRLNLKFYGDEILKNDIRRISRDVFRDEKKSELLQESIDFYNLKLEKNGYAEIMRMIPDCNWRSIVKMFCEELADYGDISSIIVRSCYQGSHSLEDFRSTDIPPSSTILKPLRKKLYGILLFEKKGSKTVEEWAIDSCMISGQPTYVSPLLPKVHHPGLASLCKENDQEAQWKLALDIFNLDSINTMNLPEHLLIPALSFRFVEECVKIDEWEMDALILSAVLVSCLSPKELGSIIIDKVVSRAVRLYNLVTCSFEAILKIFKVLKNLISADMALPCNYQDGKLFHFIYNMRYDLHLSKEEMLVEVLESFENKIKILGNCKEQIDGIINFISR